MSSSSQDTLELIHLARAGNRDALGSLLERFGDRLLGRIRMMMGAQARRFLESGDVLGTVVLEALTGFEKAGISNDDQLLRWLTSIARNKIRHEFRRRHAIAFEALSAEMVGRARGGSAHGPGSNLGADEQVEVLVEALEFMDEGSRRIIELRAFERMSFRDIGEAMEKGEDAARMQYTRALVVLGRIVRRRLS